MKMVKKILFGLVVITTLLTLTGCPKDLNDFLNNDDDDQVDTDQMVGEVITGTAGNAKIDRANETLNNARDIQLLKTKHYGSRAKIIQQDIDPNNAHGVQGFVFNVVKHEAGEEVGTRVYTENMVDFMVVSIGYAGGPNYYISAYRNITNLQATNFGADEASSAANFLKATTPVEYVIVAQPKSSTGVRGKRNSNLPEGAYKYDADEKELTVTINVVAEDDGSYTVQFYNPAKVISSTTGGWVSSLKLKDIEPTKEITIPTTVTGYEEKTQTFIGVYANVYPYHDAAGDSNEEFKLKGSWRLSGIKGEAEVAEFED